MVHIPAIGLESKPSYSSVRDDDIAPWGLQNPIKRAWQSDLLRLSNINSSPRSMLVLSPGVELTVRPNSRILGGNLLLKHEKTS